MQNLLEDVIQNETSDLIIHAGDHCYNEGDSDELRADAYMQAFEQVIGNAPWMPVVGVSYDTLSRSDRTRPSL